MNRRNFLKGFGSLSVLVMGGTVYRAYDSGVFMIGKGPAFTPWHNWRSGSLPGPLRVVQAGILAANPHNTQPWLFHVHEGAIQLFADPDRRLGAMDPYGREMHIGLGCAIENMVLAGRAEGYSCEIVLAQRELTKMNWAEPVATIRLIPDKKEKNAAYLAIPHRHTNRAAYDIDKPVSTDTRGQLQALAHQQGGSLILLTTQTDKQSFARGTIQATEAIVDDKTMATDSHSWFRPTQHDMERHRDGVTIEGLGLSPILLRLAKMVPVSSVESANQSWLNNTRNVHVATASVYGLLSVKHLYNQSDNLRVGQVWQRLHLWMTTQGLAAQPLNQLMECVDRERQLRKPPRTAIFLNKLIRQPGYQATFAFRLGYPTQVSLPVARRPVDEVLV